LSYVSACSWANAEASVRFVVNVLAKMPRRWCDTGPADVQLCGDLLVGAPVHDESKDVALSGAEPGWRVVSSR
jgi:hypothetical protein